MGIEELTAKREKLVAILADYESGKVTHYDEDERGELTRDVTAEQIEEVKRRIGDLDEKIAQSR